MERLIKKTTARGRKKAAGLFPRDQETLSCGMAMLRGGNVSAMAGRGSMR